MRHSISLFVSCCCVLVSPIAAASSCKGIPSSKVAELQSLGFDPVRCAATSTTTTPGPVCCPNDCAGSYRSFFCGGPDGLTAMVCQNGRKCGVCDNAFPIDGHCDRVTWSIPTPGANYSMKFCETPYGNVVDAYYSNAVCNAAAEVLRGGFLPSVYKMEHCDCYEPGFNSSGCCSTACEPAAQYARYFCQGMTPMKCSGWTQCGVCDKREELGSCKMATHVNTTEYPHPSGGRYYYQEICEQDDGPLHNVYYTDPACTPPIATIIHPPHSGMSVTAKFPEDPDSCKCEGL
mmetsp:Transcript_20684/g.44053  ORF Transcript_20684/g.44053 Transcript_20684/m.44053 type:complete len:290 (-) Transcript_20684:90-959(-)